MTAETTSRTIARFTVAVPRDLPTLNSRLHWSVKARRIRMARHTMYILANSERERLGIPRNNTEPRTLHLTLVRGYRQRVLDTDNAYSATKYLIDGLVDSGWLADDNATYLPQCVVTQRKDRDAEPEIECEIGVPA